MYNLKEGTLLQQVRFNIVSQLVAKENDNSVQLSEIVKDAKPLVDYILDIKTEEK